MNTQLRLKKIESSRQRKNYFPVIEKEQLVQLRGQSMLLYNPFARIIQKFFISFSSLFLLIACCSPDTFYGDEPYGKAQVSLTLEEQTYTRIEVEITGAGIERPIKLPLKISQGKAEGYLSHIPAGKNRVIRIAVFQDDTVICTAEKAIDILAGTVQEIAFVLQCKADSVARGDVHMSGKFNYPPVIYAVMADRATIPVEQPVQVIVDAMDPDQGDQLFYYWHSASGKLSSTDMPQAIWTSPQKPGSYTLTVVVKDQEGASQSAELKIEVVPAAQVTNSESSTSTEGASSTSTEGVSSSSGEATSGGTAEEGAATDENSVADNTTSATAEGEFVFQPAADTYLRSANYSDKNFGNQKELQLKYDAEEKQTRYIILKFSLNGCADITSAKLRLFGHAGKNKEAKVLIFGIADETWDETEITWNTQPPANEPAISESIVSDGLKYWEFDVSSFIAKMADDQNNVSFLIKTSTAMTSIIKFNSKEEGSNPPELIVAK